MNNNNGTKIAPEKFIGGQIRFVQAGEGNIDGKFTQWGSSIKIQGLTPKPISIPLEVIKALFTRIDSDQNVRDFVGV